MGYSTVYVGIDGFHGDWDGLGSVEWINGLVKKRKAYIYE